MTPHLNAIGHNPLTGLRCRAGLLLSAGLHALMSFSSPNELRLLRVSLDIRQVFSSVCGTGEPCRLNGLIWPKDGCASIAPAAMATRDFLPLGFAHSSRTKKVLRCHPPLHSGPKSGAAAITFGLQIAIEAAMVAGSDSQGELTWQISAPSRRPATISRARSSP